MWFFISNVILSMFCSRLLSGRSNINNYNNNNGIFQSYCEDEVIIVWFRELFYINAKC